MRFTEIPAEWQTIYITFHVIYKRKFCHSVGISKMLLFVHYYSFWLSCVMCFSEIPTEWQTIHTTFHAIYKRNFCHSIGIYKNLLFLLLFLLTFLRECFAEIPPEWQASQCYCNSKPHFCHSVGISKMLLFVHYYSFWLSCVMRFTEIPAEWQTIYTTFLVIYKRKFCHSVIISKNTSI
jgi:hypothetical protein